MLLFPAAGGAAPPDEVSAASGADRKTPEAAVPLSAGDLVATKYRLERLLGEGGMGVVWLGRHIELEQPVAIKFLRPKVAHGETVVARFLNEARAAAALRSDHVVRVMDVGQLPSGLAYIVMEHLEGIDLEALLRNDGPLGVEDTLEYALQACSALLDAHALGIIHRDIKPENLFLTRRRNRDVIKIVDFGLAKRIDVEQERKLTGPHDYMGSPCYMSPEQMTAPHQVDARTDIWSMGIVLYQLLSGTLPFDGSTVVEVCAQVLHATPRPLPELRQDVDDELDAIVRRCLEKRPEERYPSVADLVEELERYRSAALSDTQVMRSAKPSMRAASSGRPGVEQPPKRPRGPLPILAGVALLAIACGAAGTFAVDRMGWMELGGITDGILTPAALAEDWAPLDGEGSRSGASIPLGDRMLVKLRAPPSAEPWAARDAEGDASASGASTAAVGSAAVGDEASAVTRSQPGAGRTRATDEGIIAPPAAPPQPPSYRAYLEREGLRPLRDVLAEEEQAASPSRGADDGADGE